MRRLWKRSARRHSGRLCTVCVLIWTLIFPPTLFAPQRALAAFVQAPSEHLPTTTDATHSFAVGDVDGDGDPDVLVVNFDLTLEPSCQPLLPIEETTVSFAPRPGTLSRLEAVSDNTLLVVGSLTPGVGTMSPVDLVQLANDDLGHYDPSRYRLTTPEGVVFELDQGFGVRTITESNGNTLHFTPNGILHSAGKSVSFIRDAAGRITQITDPNGNTLTYTYDAHGDLVVFQINL